MKELSVKICPKCGGTNISTRNAKIIRYYCKDCLYGYSPASIFPEVNVTKIEEFRKELKRIKQKPSTSNK